jgi:hypothetical protein
MQLETFPPPVSVSPYTVARRFPRALFSVPITLHELTTGGIRASHGISLDLSEGGFGAIVKGDTYYPGETVEIDFPLPGCMLSLVAIVRHTSTARIGFEFLGLTENERSQITTAAAIQQPS